MPTASRHPPQVAVAAPTAPLPAAPRPPLVAGPSVLGADPPTDPVPRIDPDTSHIQSLTISPEEARDQALVLLARNGDQQALADLLTTHQDRVFAVCLRMTGDRDAAEDLAQETLLRVIKNLDQFNHKARFTTWLTRVAMNVCLTAFRKNRLRKTVSLDAMGGDPGASQGGTGLFKSLSGDTFLGAILGKLFGAGAGDTTLGTRAGETKSLSRKFTGSPARERDVVESAELSESLSRLYIALEELDPEQRAILILRDMQGLDYQHIADILEVPPGTVKSRIFRARTALREKFDGVRPE